MYLDLQSYRGWTTWLLLRNLPHPRPEHLAVGRPWSLQSLSTRVTVHAASGQLTTRASRSWSDFLTLRSVCGSASSCSAQKNGKSDSLSTCRHLLWHNLYLFKLRSLVLYLSSSSIYYVILGHSPVFGPSVKTATLHSSVRIQELLSFGTTMKYFSRAKPGSLQ